MISDILQNWSSFRRAVTAIVLSLFCQPQLSAQSIDAFIDQELAASHIEPSPACSDAEFLRRATLDVTGFLPTRDELSAFQNDSRQNKRSLKIDELLVTDAYAWKWGNWLAVLSGCDEQELNYASVELQVSSGQLTHLWVDWMRVRIARDEPYDNIVAGLLEATSREGQSGRAYYAWLDQWTSQLNESFADRGMFANRRTNDLFWRRYSAIYDPYFPAESIAKAFLGVRLDCARCHDHPSAPWKQADHHGFAATMQQVRYSELPLTASEKRYTLALMGGLFVVVAGLIWGLGKRVTHSRFRRVGMTLRASGFGLVGVLLVLGASYGHVFSLTPNAAIQSPATPLVALFEKWRLPHDMAAMVVFTIVGVVAGLIAILVRWISRTNRARRETLVWAVGMMSFGASLALVADMTFQLRQDGGRAEKTPLAHHLHRRVLRRLGLGGCGQQPREVFLSDERGGELSEPRLLNGTVLANRVGQDLRRDVVTWLRRDDVPYLARNIVNRVWAEYFGRGLVEPLDDMSDSNPPSHPELLGWLATEFLAHSRSMRHLHRTILNSTAYQRSSRATPMTRDDSPHYGRFLPRRLSAEQLIAGVDSVTGTLSTFGDKNAPPGASPFQVGLLYPGGDTFGARAMRLYGRSTNSRDLRVEAAMFGVVDPTLVEKIVAPQGRLRRLLDAKRPTSEILDDFFITAYSRKPSDTERWGAFEYTEGVGFSPLAGWSDVVWAMINSQEFQFIH